MRDEKAFRFKRNDAAARSLSDAFTQLPALAQEGPQFAQLAIRHAGRLEQAKLRSLERDRVALAAKHGNQDARVAALDMRIERHHDFRVALEALDARAAAEPPSTPKNAATIYGRVVRSKGAPLQGVRVVALSAVGKRLGADATDKEGAYTIRLAAKSPAAAKAAGAARKKATVAYLEVQGADGIVLHRAADPITVEPSASLYQEIVADDPRDDQPGERPRAARSVAKHSRGPRKKPAKPKEPR